MQAVMRNRGLMIAILVVAILAAVFIITCSDGIHVASPTGTVAGCLTMSHTSVLGAAIGSSADRLLPPTMLATLAGLAMFMVAVGTAAAPAPHSVTPGKPNDPLHGRLRL